MVHAWGLPDEAVTHQPGRADRVVVRPDRAVVVAHRVVGSHRCGQRADAPATEHLRGHQVPRNRVRLAFVDDAGPQAVPDVRGERVDRAFVTVKPDRVPALVRQPESGVEVAFQLLGLLPPGRSSALIAGLTGKPRPLPGSRLAAALPP